MNADLAKSSLSGVAQFVVSTSLVLIAIPIFIKTLGTEAYGLFCLVALVGNVSNFANLGLNSSLVRFLAEQGKTVESNYDIAVNFMLLVAIVCPLAAGGIVFHDAILINVLNVPHHLLEDARWLFVSMLFGSVLILLGQTFTAMMDSQQKIYLTNLYMMVHNVAYWGSIVLVVLLGFSLKAVAVAILASIVLWFCLVSVGGLRSWGKLEIIGLKSNMLRVARKQFSYGFQLYIGGIIFFFYEPLTKILVSRFIGVTEVGFFDIGLRVRNQLSGLASKLLYPLFPIIAKTGDRNKISRLVHDVEQKSVIVIMPAAAIVLLTARPLTSLFFSSNIDAISITVATIVVAYLLGSYTLIPNYLFLMAKGYASKTIVVQSVNVLVNIVIFVVLLPWLGYYSAVAANAVAICSSGVLLIYYQKRYLNSVIFDSWEKAVQVFASFVISLTLGYLCSSMANAFLWKLIVPTVVVATVSSFMCRYFSLIDASDVSRYLGEDTVLSKLSIRILCKNAVG